MTNCTLAIEPSPKPEDIAVIDDGIAEFNRASGADDSYTSLTILLRNEQGDVVGGLLGGSYWGMLNIAIIWLAEPYRRHGYGRQMVTLAEQEAVRRGCQRVLLESASFQAVSFYEKLGYRVFSTVEGIPIGYSISFLEKTL